MVKLTPEGRKGMAAGDYPGLPTDEIIVTAHLADPPHTQLPEARIRPCVLHRAHCKPLHGHSFRGLGVEGETVSTQMMSTGERLCGPLPFRVRHREPCLNPSTGVAC